MTGVPAHSMPGSHARARRTLRALALVLLCMHGAPLTAQSGRTRATPRMVTRDNVLRFSLDAAGGVVNAHDVLNDTTLARVTVCPKPVSGTLSANDVSFIVRCRGNASVVINTASFIATSLPGTPRTTGTRTPPAPAAANALNTVVMVGTIHAAHRTSSRYSLDVLRRLIREIRPDYVLTEIPPNRLAAATQEFETTGQIVEPRVSRFPEYVDVLFPLTREMPFTIIPAAAWTRPMDHYRTAALRRLGQDPSRRTEWGTYQAAIRLADSLVTARGADDPYFVNSAQYDSIQTAAHEPYNRFFNRDLGPGGWDNINTAHYALVSAALDAHRGDGRRFLITYGAGHREWFLRQLRKRDDITLVEVAPFLDRIGASGAKPQ